MRYRGSNDDVSRPAEDVEQVGARLAAAEEETAALPEVDLRRRALARARREIAILAPLVLLTIFYGVYPAPVLDVTATSVKNLVQNYQSAQGTAAASAAPQGTH